MNFPYRIDDDDDRQNRFLTETHSHLTLRERAASQPPRSSGFVPSPSIPAMRTTSGGAPSPWTSRVSSGLNPHAVPHHVPARSASFSTSYPSSALSSALRESRAFPSTFEDDESEADSFDDYARGRSYAHDVSRSRSQSLATRPGPIGSAVSALWNPPPQLKPPAARFGPIARSPAYDHSNMSPFVRDLGQILLDDGSAFRELWAGANPPRDENGGGGSGTTSRRHSVSVVQSRRPTIVGFNAPSTVPDDRPFRPAPSGLLLTDDDLASDLGLLALGPPVQQQHQQPSSLPIYTPLSRSPPDRLSPYQPLHLNIPARNNPVGSPSSAGSHEPESPFLARQQARFVPGHGIPEQAVLTTPLYPANPLHDLGKGMPLHAMPTAWPLYIVEFKAGRTDLFYSTDLALDVRLGDLVVVEADRGKDLGKVVNDSISLAEVDAFQKQQKLAHDPPTSPAPTKEINPKMIYGKAQPHDLHGLAMKLQDESKALELCRSKVRQRKLPMEVVDAEYQWDRRKLTFYFVAEKRIDFRELVRELFRLYKTRIWMASLGGAGSLDQ